MYDHYNGSSEDDESSESKHSSAATRRTNRRISGQRNEEKVTNYEEEKGRIGGGGGGEMGEERIIGEREQKQRRKGRQSEGETTKTGESQRRTTPGGDKAQREEGTKGAAAEQILEKNSPRSGGQQKSKKTEEGSEHAEQSGDYAIGTEWAMPTLRQDVFDHFSFTCHLFPRLSESNLQFHDIYWDREPSTKFVTLRKRKVFVTKLVRSLLVRHVGAVEGDAGTLRTEFRADFSLIDRRPFARREVVSNIFTVQVPISSGGGPRRLFRKEYFVDHCFSFVIFGPSSASVLVRSNYRQRAVALQILLQRSTTFAHSQSLHSVGRVELELLDENAKMALPSRTHSFAFENNIRFEFETANVPNREQIQADSLPDVLICDESWLPMLAIYRQLICETLSEEGDVFADRSVWVVDPVMATFPALLDTDRDGVDLLIGLMHKFSVDNRELTPQTATRRFRFVYMHFILPLTALIEDGKWREKLRTFVKGRLDAEEPNPIKMFATEPCKAMDMFEYALNLCGEHSID